MFSVHSEIKSTTFDLIYFVADGARRARSKIWMHFFPLNKTPRNL